MSITEAVGNYGSGQEIYVCLFYTSDTRSTVCKLAVRDESDTYIRENVFDNIIFYPENFSFMSEKSGYNHLYWYSISGNLLKQVTSGSYEVQDFLGYDTEDGSFYYLSLINI